MKALRLQKERLLLTFLGGVFFFLLAWSLRDSKKISYSQIRAQYRSSDLQLLDRNGKVLTEIRNSNQIRHLSWVAFSDFPEVLKRNVLASEDRNFYSHHGVDYKALFAASYQRLFHGSQRGASTISMQVANLLNPDLKKQRFYKWLQIRQAWQLEEGLTKNQILEIYLNLLHFRGEFQGIRTAGLALFQKEPNSLNGIDSAILSAMIRSPNAPWELIQKRACWLANQEMDCNLISESIQKLASEKPQIPPPKQLALQLGQRIQSDMRKSHSTQDIVNTTLDLETQQFTQDRLDSQIQELSIRNVRNGAVLVLDNHSGEVLAYVAGSNQDPGSIYVDHIQSYRQAGSTLKPFLYTAAIEREVISPNSWLSDQPLDLVYSHGTYSPRNHDRQFSGWVPAKIALASSLNLPAVRLFELLPSDLMLEKLKLLGFSRLREPEFYGPGLALGSADITLWDLANAYRSLANLGTWSPASYLQQSGDNLLETKKVFSDTSTKTVIQILANPENRTHSFGFNSVLNTSFPSFVKTGTSKDMRDNWCVGSSRDYTVAVWIGNSAGDSMWNILGISGAAPLWNEVITWLHENKKSQSEWPNIEDLLKFPDVERLEPRLTKVKITYPSDNAVLAFDPDLPTQVQKLPLTFEGSEDNLQWWINGKIFNAKGKQTLWPIKRGKYKIQLQANGKSLDQISILVK